MPGSRVSLGLQARQHLARLLGSAETLPERSKACRVLTALACRLQLFVFELERSRHENCGLGIEALFTRLQEHCQLLVVAGKNAGPIQSGYALLAELSTLLEDLEGSVLLIPTQLCDEDRYKPARDELQALLEDVAQYRSECEEMLTQLETALSELVQGYPPQHPAGRLPAAAPGPTRASTPSAPPPPLLTRSSALHDRASALAAAAAVTDVSLRDLGAPSSSADESDSSGSPSAADPSPDSASASATDTSILSAATGARAHSSSPSASASLDPSSVASAAGPTASVAGHAAAGGAGSPAGAPLDDVAVLQRVRQVICGLDLDVEMEERGQDLEAELRQLRDHLLKAVEEPHSPLSPSQPPAPAGGSADGGALQLPGHPPLGECRQAAMHRGDVMNLDLGLGLDWRLHSPIRSPEAASPLLGAGNHGSSADGSEGGAGTATLPADADVEPGEGNPPGLLRRQGARRVRQRSFSGGTTSSGVGGGAALHDVHRSLCRSRSGGAAWGAGAGGGGRAHREFLARRVSRQLAKQTIDRLKLQQRQQQQLLEHRSSQGPQVPQAVGPLGGRSSAGAEAATASRGTSDGDGGGGEDHGDDEERLSRRRKVHALAGIDGGCNEPAPAGAADAGGGVTVKAAAGAPEGDGARGAGVEGPAGMTPGVDGVTDHPVGRAFGLEKAAKGDTGTGEGPGAADGEGGARAATRGDASVVAVRHLNLVTTLAGMWEAGGPVQHQQHPHPLPHLAHQPPQPEGGHRAGEQEELPCRPAAPAARQQPPLPPLPTPFGALAPVHNRCNSPFLLAMPKASAPNAAPTVPPPLPLPPGSEGLKHPREAGPPAEELPAPPAAAGAAASASPAAIRMVGRSPSGGGAAGDGYSPGQSPRHQAAGGVAGAGAGAGAAHRQRFGPAPLPLPEAFVQLRAVGAAEEPAANWLRWQDQGPLGPPGFGIGPWLGLVGDGAGVLPAAAAMAAAGPPLPLDFGPDVPILDLRKDITSWGPCLGRGAFGAVYKALFRTKPVAVKVLHGSALDSSDLMGLRTEISLLCRLRHHPNIITVFGAAAAPPDAVALVTELMDCDLYDYIHRRRQNCVPLDEVLFIARSIATGLAELHPAIVHRDLKPANVLLRSSVPHGTGAGAAAGGAGGAAVPGTNPNAVQHAAQGPAAGGAAAPGGGAQQQGAPGMQQGPGQGAGPQPQGCATATPLDRRLTVKIADFGLARNKRSQYLSTRERHAGTLKYMAPECVTSCGSFSNGGAEGDKAGSKVTEKCDVYSFGVLLYELITGREPWEGCNAWYAFSQVQAGVTLQLPDDPDRCPVALRSLVQRCWALEHHQRPSSKELVEALEGIIAGRPAA